MEHGLNLNHYKVIIFVHIDSRESVYLTRIHGPTITCAPSYLLASIHAYKPSVLHASTHECKPSVHNAFAHAYVPSVVHDTCIPHLFDEVRAQDETFGLLLSCINYKGMKHNFMRGLESSLILIL